MDQSEIKSRVRGDMRLLSRRKAAELLHVSTKTLFRWERAGRLKAIKLNSRTTRYFEHDVEKLISDAVVADWGGAV
jgi:predicted site-specific integrase-resolvase